MIGERDNKSIKGLFRCFQERKSLLKHCFIAQTHADLFGHLHFFNGDIFIKPQIRVNLMPIPVSRLISVNSHSLIVLFFEKQGQRIVLVMRMHKKSAALFERIQGGVAD